MLTLKICTLTLHYQSSYLMTEVATARHRQGVEQAEGSAEVSLACARADGAGGIGKEGLWGRLREDRRRVG